MDNAMIREFFRENGYYVARGAYSPESVRPLIDEFDRIVAQLKGSGEQINGRWSGEEMERLDGGESAIIHTHNVQYYSAAWLQALLHDGFLDIAEAILGPDVILHHTKLFQKPPEKGSPFPVHQDWEYFPSKRDTMIAGVIHLSEATDEMGCLRLYPGSHKLGRLGSSKGTGHSEILSRYPIEEATVVECEPGDVVFFHYLTLHGSLPNRSNKARKTVLVQLHAGNDTLENGGAGHPYSRLVLRGWNSLVTRETANVAS